MIAVNNAATAVYPLALTSLRNIIVQHDLDGVLRQRDKINDLLRAGIASSTVAWGLEVERFEMKDVELPEAMKQVMGMQAEAIREKRARIIKAEAEMEASLNARPRYGQNHRGKTRSRHRAIPPHAHRLRCKVRPRPDQRMNIRCDVATGNLRLALMGHRPGWFVGGPSKIHKTGCAAVVVRLRMPDSGQASRSWTPNRLDSAGDRQ